MSYGTTGGTQDHSRCYAKMRIVIVLKLINRLSDAKWCAEEKVKKKPAVDQIFLKFVHDINNNNACFFNHSHAELPLTN